MSSKLQRNKIEDLIQSNMYNIEEAKSFVEDIDLPLYRYGLIHKQDINNYYESEKNRKLQKFKSYTLSIWMFVCIIRWLFLLKYFQNPNYEIFFNDIIQNFGGIPEFNYMIALLTTILSFRIICIFNFSDSNHYQWLHIIEVLKGLKTLKTIGDYHDKQIEKFVQKISSYFAVIDLCIRFLLFWLILMSVFVLIFFFDSFTVIGYGILNVFWFCLWSFCITNIIAYSFFYYFIVCFYFIIAFKSLNNKITQIEMFYRRRKVNQIIIEHKLICDDINKYNKFWKKYYFAINYTLIPINLMLLHQLLFEELIFSTFVVSVLFLFSYSLSHFLFNLLTASINRESLKSHKYLQKLLTKNLFLMNVKQKLKVL